MKYCGNTSIHRAKTDRMVCVVAKWIPLNLPHPPILANLCVKLKEQNYIYIYEVTDDDVLHHRQLDCCFKSMPRLTTNKISKLRIRGLLWVEPPVTGLLCYKTITLRLCLIRPKPDVDFKIRILKPWGSKQTECWIRIRFLENKWKIWI